MLSDVGSSPGVISNYPGDCGQSLFQNSGWCVYVHVVCEGVYVQARESPQGLF